MSTARNSQVCEGQVSDCAGDDSGDACVLQHPIQSHSTLSHVSSYHSFTQIVRCSQEHQCGEVADGAGDAPTDACVEQRPAEPQHPQPRRHSFTQHSALLTVVSVH